MQVKISCSTQYAEKRIQKADATSLATMHGNQSMHAFGVPILKVYKWSLTRSAL